MVKVQLLLVIKEDSDFNKWKYWIDTNIFDDYSVVDVLYFGDKQHFMTIFSSLFNRKDFFIHLCSQYLENQLNYLIREDCDYYIVNSIPGTLPNNLPQQLNNKHAVLIKSEDGYNNLVVYTKMSFDLCHWGGQSIEEKISIHATNHQREDVVYGSISEYTTVAGS